MRFGLVFAIFDAFTEVFPEVDRFGRQPVVNFLGPQHFTFGEVNVGAIVGCPFLDDIELLALVESEEALGNGFMVDRCGRWRRLPGPLVQFALELVIFDLKLVNGGLEATIFLLGVGNVALQGTEFLERPREWPPSLYFFVYRHETPAAFREGRIDHGWAQFHEGGDDRGDIQRRCVGLGAVWRFECVAWRGTEGWGGRQARGLRCRGSRPPRLGSPR